MLFLLSEGIMVILQEMYTPVYILLLRINEVF